jgi:hypothetical protein
MSINAPCKALIRSDICASCTLFLDAMPPLEALFCAQPAPAGDLRIGGQWQPLSARARWWRHQDEIGNPRRNSKTMHCDAHTRAYERTAPVESIESFAIE